MSLKLINSIVNSKKQWSDISEEELESVIDASIFHSNYRALESLTNYYTGIYDFDERKPYWLSNDFAAPQWKLDIRKTESTIAWDAVTLDDGLNLTHPKHEKLLNAFKYWIVSIGNPHENGGQLLAKRTVAAYLDCVLLMINAILLNSDLLKLSQYHLTKVNRDFWLSIIHNIAKYADATEGIYGYKKRFKILLDKKIKSVDSEAAQQFADQYPFIRRTIIPEEQTFNFSVQQRIKACYWLYQQGYYQIGAHKKYQGHSPVIKQILFEGKSLPLKLNLPLIEELWIQEPQAKNEYRSIDCPSDVKGFSQRGLMTYIRAIKLINTTHSREDCSQPPIDSTLNLNIDRINEVFSLKKAGRTRTLPPKLVFKLFKQCYEFTIEHQNTILNSVLNVLREAKHKSAMSTSNPNYRYGYDSEIPSTELGAFLKYDALAFVDEHLIKFGVKTVSAFSPNIENRHKKIRNNESLFNLYDILMGSIQMLVGSVMGRRQDELIKLKSHGNLSPNIDPYSDEGLEADFELVFMAKKTGIGGENGTNATIKRPIVNSIARFIWTLEQFNIAASHLKVSKGTLSLFNKLNSKNLMLSKTRDMTFNYHLDAICDYFETSLIQVKNGEYRRNYVRQHQLRRFFAMCFFWSKGFDGMDSLRWMLGHSDLEHLYHYISESETGAVLNGAKASVIVRGITDKNSELAKLENIDKLEALIAKRFGVQGEGSILISTLSNASEDYDSEDYKTIPSISQIQAEQKLESQVITLLEDHSITLEPNFFTVQDEKGETVNTFTLVLEVKELD
ncbi:TPA: integrase [Vibrio diabolicus]